MLYSMFYEFSVSVTYSLKVHHFQLCYVVVGVVSVLRFLDRHP